MTTHAPSPSPDFGETAPTPTPAPATPTALSTPACAACGAQAVVHWRRRPTDDELAELVAVERVRRDELLLLADPRLPAPQFGPLPTAEGVTRTVYACGPHAITLEAASRTHQSSCTAPNDADLPDCDCTPEALPESAATTSAESEAPSRLPAHWLPGGE